MFAVPTAAGLVGDAVGRQPRLREPRPRRSAGGRRQTPRVDLVPSPVMASDGHTISRVLVVDDDTTFLDFVTKAIQDVVSCEVAMSGHGALGRLQRSRFNVILLDLKLPDVSGLDVLRAIRARREPPAVVLMSGAGTIASAVEAMKLGAQDFLEKPIVMTDLLDVVRSYLPEQDEGADAAQPGDGMDNLLGLVLAIAEGSEDVPTVEAWARVVGLSVPTLYARCRRAGVRAKAMLDLGRLLFVGSASSGEARAATWLLKSRDSRTVDHLLSRSGLRQSDLTDVDPGTLLRRQALLTDGPLLIALRNRVITRKK